MFHSLRPPTYTPPTPRFKINQLDLLFTLRSTKNLICGLRQERGPVPGHPDGGEAAGSLALGRAGRVRPLPRNGVQVVGAVFRVGGAGAQQHRVLGRVVGHGVDRAARSAAQLQHRRVPKINKKLKNNLTAK